MPLEGRHIEIRGVVQGVGFRPFVYQVARRCGITVPWLDRYGDAMAGALIVVLGVVVTALGV